MKIAEALVTRADHLKRLASLRARLQQAGTTQEGETPPEPPLDLIAETDQIVDRLTDLIIRINRTNLVVTLPDGATLTTALARRDALALRMNALNNLIESASSQVSRYSRSEIKLVPTVEIAPLRRQWDELARQRRELDVAIQALNWSADLLD